MDKLERIRGCFLAGAAGDALGYQVEFDSLNVILALHGEHGVRTMARRVYEAVQ